MKLIKLATVFVFASASTVGHASTPAQTFDFNYSGNIAFHNDVVEIPFTIPVASVYASGPNLFTAEPTLTPSLVYGI